MPADDSYYYYRGSKVPLDRDLDRIVVIAPTAEDVSLPESDGFTLVNTIDDTHSSIRVYRLTSSHAAGRAVEAVSSQSANIMPCYRSENGGELIPNGYLNVRLKSAADYPALQAVALQEGCEIIGRNPFMPLWYNLRVKDNPGLNPVAIANAVYETGKFACSFPSFSLDAALISYDPKVSKQWGLYNSDYEGIDISMSKAWSYATGRGIAVTRGREGKGCVVVAAVGNVRDHHPTAAITFPANCGPEVIAVSNMTIDGTLADDSCYGPNLLVTAPGTCIYSTLPKDTVGEMSGTSMACPHVAGLAALILERNPSLTYEEVREVIARNTKKVGGKPYRTSKEYGTWNEKYGYGLIDAYKAVINTPRKKE